VDRHRGFTAVVVHLRMGPSPAPDGPRYNFLAQDFERFLKAQRESLEALEKLGESGLRAPVRRNPRTRARPMSPPNAVPPPPGGTATKSR
jgi:hypothetical protein